MKNAFLLYACFLISAMPACRQQPAPAETPSGEISLKEYFRPAESGIQTGGVKMVEIESPKGKFKVWTKRIGNNPKIKLLLLHGGPGVNHDYFECMESFLPQEGIEFIYYDQLGSGYSDIPQDTSLWELDRFVEEVEQVRQALGLTPEQRQAMARAAEAHAREKFAKDTMCAKTLALYQAVMAGRMRAR